MGATLQYLFYNAVVSVGSTLVTLGAAYKLFGERLIERLFGHILDGRLQKEKERHELALANLKHEQDAQIEDLRAMIAHLTSPVTMSLFDHGISGAMMTSIAVSPSMAKMTATASVESD
jgi:hypothetical protein